MAADAVMKLRTAFVLALSDAVPDSRI